MKNGGVRKTVFLWMSVVALLPLGLGALEPTWYVGGALGEKVTAGPLPLLAKESFGEGESEDASYKVLAGLHLGSYFAVEASYVNFGAQHLDAVADFGFDVDVDGYTASLVGAWPIGRVTLFGKAGSFWWNEEGKTFGLLGISPYSNDGRDLVLGAGLKVEITPHLRLRGEWERFGFEDEDAYDLWAGLEFRF